MHQGWSYLCVGGFADGDWARFDGHSRITVSAGHRLREPMSLAPGAINYTSVAYQEYRLNFFIVNYEQVFYWQAANEPDHQSIQRLIRGYRQCRDA